ncbi:MAG: sugar phosphate isomerase/epimerase, partial [Lentisphaerae bacterium]|nr:sugar phosphate isomerase/epimerase [Lentisphaerota bacterium]
GFADEAAPGIDGQIKATKELGWKFIESRNIDGKNIHDLSDSEFDVVCGKLQDAGIRINCFGSAIANWGKSITDPFDSSLAEMERAIPRMKKLGTKLIRIMSFAVLKDRGPDDQMQEERFRRVRELQKRFSDEGLVPVHENCMNYGGMGWHYTMRLLENVPGLKLVFDTGNPIGSDDMYKDPPRPKQSSWEFYSHVKDHIAYVHIKDGIWHEDTGKAEYTFPGEGQGDVRRIMRDLIANGYDGGISIEPHMAVQAHDKSIKAEADVRYDNYVEYGRRMSKIIEEAKRK